MRQNIIKNQIADVLCEAFKAYYNDIYQKTGDEQVFSADFILSNIEKPKDTGMGRYAFPVFKYGKLLGANPPKIASEIAETANNLIKNNTKYSELEKVTSVAGFINISTDFLAETSRTIKEVLEKEAAFGCSDAGKDKRMLVEYSSVNIAKPFGIGHLRTTILGNSLRRIFKKLGYDTMGINYLGDWGTQFGKMIVAFQKWGDELSSENESVSYLYELYVRFHQEADADDTLNDLARQAFKKLEDGDRETTELWERFKEASWKEFERIYKLMGIEFDWITGEAFMNNKMEPLIKRMEQAGLTSVSDGALIVDLHDPQLPPCLLRKADGATLYATRDLAGLMYRWEKYRFDEMLYVVGGSQSDHFKQVFKTIAMLEEAENLPADDRVSGRAKHIEFGWVKFGDKKMATRMGNIIFLDDVIKQAVELAGDKIKEKNPNLKDLDETAHMIGIGAVLFSQLSVRRQKDVNFDWDEVLSFEGETGPYLQYTHARLCSLMRNYEDKIHANIDFSLLKNEEEQRIIELLADFPEAVDNAGHYYEPNFIATHLIKLAGAFNKFYQRKDEAGKIDKIISDNAQLTQARFALVKAVQVVVNEGLYLLGIKAPLEM